MSSSVGYYLSAADIEASRRRGLRARIAMERTKLRAALRRAAAVGVQLERVSGRRHTSTEDVATADLEAELDALEAEVRGIQQDVDATLTKRLTDRISRSVPASTENSATVGRSTQHRGGTVAPTSNEREAGAWAATFRDARVLLTRSVGRCDPADVAELTELVERLAGTESLAKMRADAVAVAVRIKESVERRKAADQVAQTRARLISLLADALPEERASLVDSVSLADDPADWEPAVHDAIHRADLMRERRRVAEVAMSALAGAGCALGDDFATLLVDHNEAVIPLPHQPDHGVLVRLPADGTRLTAAVVRADDRPREHDVDAQRTFCTEVLHHLEDGVRAAGIQLTEFVRRQPGQYPVAPAPAGGWCRAGGGTASRTQRRPPRVEQPMRERHRGH